MQAATVYLGLGSNLGDRAEHIALALRELGELPGTDVLGSASPLETAPVGPIDQGPYLNAAAEVRTTLAPRDLLAAIHAIEQAHGRDRRIEPRWGPRTLDLDILVYADLVIDEPGLTIPHPRLAERWFVLAPLAQIAPELVVPGQRQTVRGLLAALERRGVGASP